MANRKLKLIKKIKPRLESLASPCMLCGHLCRVIREKGQKGTCGALSKVRVYSSGPHPGEEPPLSGTGGSGAIFFSCCSMKCVYCQNYTFSQKITGEEVDAEELAGMMLRLQRAGCRNINLVSPTHYAYQAVSALEIALKKSLCIPVVYNTGGYDNPELIRLLDGIIDIYLPDMRYSDDANARRFSSARNYSVINRKIVKEMFRQAGVLRLSSAGVAQKGVIVRLLVLPNGISGTVATLRFLKKEVSPEIYLSLMSQYHPTYLACRFSEIARRITRNEYREITGAAEKLGFTNGWVQGFETETERFLGTRIKPFSENNALFS
ncbi:MAG: radical SAM protein [Candidatus Omnitrophica bacterium]|nr:radical SAM protein [Candidatus Omnitrophota bacterium]